MLELPRELHNAIQAALGQVHTEHWVAAAQTVSLRYRGEREGGEARLVRTDLEALGYAALVLPAAYAQLWGAMRALALRNPNWQPRTLLDLGSGPGTGLWAAAAHWASIERMGAIEREEALIKLGKLLGQAGNTPALRTVRWQRGDLNDPYLLPNTRYDLVVIGHVLNELEPAAREALIARAWALTEGVLLIVEPGTSSAFPFVNAARDQLRTLGAHTLAPCPHDHPCPLHNDWCHFPQRIVRPAFQRCARGAPSQWEESKYAYAALARFTPPAPIAGRIIREPTHNKAYAEAISCQADGCIAPRRALKRDREAYRAVAELEWGGTENMNREPRTENLCASAASAPLR